MANQDDAIFATVEGGLFEVRFDGSDVIVLPEVEGLCSEVFRFHENSQDNSSSATLSEYDAELLFLSEGYDDDVPPQQRANTRNCPLQMPVIAGRTDLWGLFPATITGAYRQSRNGSPAGREE